jgi:hypothetical protein
MVNLNMKLALRGCVSALVGALLSALLSACGGGVAPLSLSDPRLPTEAKWRVADAQDAVVVAEGALADASRALSEAQSALSRVSGASALGAARSSAEALAEAKVSLAITERDYAHANLKRARARLTLMYAQTAVRHDFKLYDLAPLITQAEQASERALSLRRAINPARAAVAKAADQWWDAYLRLDGAGRAFWVSEFGR